MRKTSSNKTHFLPVKTAVSALAVSVAAWAFIFGAYSPTADSEQNQMAGKAASSKETGKGIEQQIRSKLLTDPRIRSTSLSVDEDEGKVTLSGKVDSLLASEAAVWIAKSTPGVTRVISKLEVQPSEKHTDQQIGRRVESLLASEAQLNAERMDITVEEGKVTLSGTVSSYGQRGLAENTVARVQGVKSIENRLAVEVPERETLEGALLRESLRENIEANPLIDFEDEVTVFTERSTVTLKGRVDNMYEHATLMRDALESGAERVINQVAIDAPPDTLLEQEYYAIDPTDMATFGRYVYEPPWGYSPFNR